MTTINIAKGFSDVPAGRYRSDGPFSGQRFREDHLVPALKQGGVVSVVLDGTEGFGSSFLEEAFGGLVRQHGFSAGELRKRLRIVSKDTGYADEVWQYIEQEDARQHLPQAEHQKQRLPA